MSEYNGDNICFIPTEEVMSWVGKPVIVKTNDGIEVKGVVANLVLPGPAHNPSEWLGLNVDGQITLSPGVIRKIYIQEDD